MLKIMLLMMRIVVVVMMTTESITIFDEDWRQTRRAMAVLWRVHHTLKEKSLGDGIVITRSGSVLFVLALQSKWFSGTRSWEILPPFSTYYFDYGRRCCDFVQLVKSLSNKILAVWNLPEHQILKTHTLALGRLLALDSSLAILLNFDKIE